MWGISLLVNSVDKFRKLYYLLFAEKNIKEFNFTYLIGKSVKKWNYIYFKYNRKGKINQMIVTGENLDLILEKLELFLEFKNVYFFIFELCKKTTYFFCKYNFHLFLQNEIMETKKNNIIFLLRILELNSFYFFFEHNLNFIFFENYFLSFKNKDII